MLSGPLVVIGVVIGRFIRRFNFVRFVPRSLSSAPNSLYLQRPSFTSTGLPLSLFSFENIKN